MTYHVAIIGSGPAGFYVAEGLLQNLADVRVDVIERLPVPFGLVRHGVAPDHQKLKAVTTVFDSIAADERFSFLGNIEIGRDLGISALQESYDAVVMATGAMSDRPMDVVGEQLPGSVSATEFVGWYNGHPDFRDKVFDFSHPTAVVVGNGNVALDVCRILAKTPEELRNSDICEHALDALSASKITRIVLAGRRGPAQAKFTPKELREFGDLRDAQPTIDPGECDLDPVSITELTSPAQVHAKRNIEIMRAFGRIDAEVRKQKRIEFRFLLSPVRIEGETSVARIVFARNRLSGEPFAQIATPTGEELAFDAGLVIRSVGYKGRPLPGVPFDRRSATIPNNDGRVIDDKGNHIRGLYTAGWIKRGPSGVIGTNRACGSETAAAIIEDFQNLRSSAGSEKARNREYLLSSLGERMGVLTDFSAWKRIDALELAIGASRGKPREKFTTISGMIAAARAKAPVISQA